MDILTKMKYRVEKQKKKRKKNCNASFTPVSVLVAHDIGCEYEPHRVLYKCEIVQKLSAFDVEYFN